MLDAPKEQRGRGSFRESIQFAVPDAVFRIPKWARYVLLVVLGAVIGPILVAIFGNLATDEVHTVAWPWLSGPIVVARGTTVLFVAIVLALLIYFQLSISRGSSVRRLSRELRVQSDKTADVSRQVGRMEEQLQRSVEVSDLMQEKCLNAEACRLSLTREFTDSFLQIGPEKYVAWWTRLVESLLESLCNKVFTGGDLVEHGSVLLPERSGDYLRIALGSRVASESLRNRRFYCGHDERLLQERGVTGTAFAERRPIYEPDVEHSLYHVPLEGHRIAYKSLLAAPLARNEDPALGVISLGCRGEMTQVALDAHLLQNVSSVLATALRALHDAGVKNESLFAEK